MGCPRLSDHLLDLIKQINDLLDQKHSESGTQDDDKRQAALALETFFGSHRDRWLREWLEYQPLFIALASWACSPRVQCLSLPIFLPRI